MNMDNAWIMDIDDKVFSIIKSIGTKELKSKYPNINFTTSDKGSATQKFPTIYVHSLSGLELGQDITRKSINAIMKTYQIEVYSDESQATAKKVMSVIMCIMKELGFEITASPEFDNETTIYRSVARYRRVIGSGDTL